MLTHVKDVFPRFGRHTLQCRRDFIANEGGVSPPLSVQEECLGLAVLDLWRMAKERNQSVREVCNSVRYPRSEHFCSRKHGLYK